MNSELVLWYNSAFRIQIKIARPVFQDELQLAVPPELCICTTLDSLTQKIRHPFRAQLGKQQPFFSVHKRAFSRGSFSLKDLEGVSFLKVFCNIHNIAILQHSIIFCQENFILDFNAFIGKFKRSSIYLNTLFACGDNFNINGSDFY